jgi:hypothetical protein
MSTLREAAQQALEALDGLSEPYHVLKAQDALRAALAQQEQERVIRGLHSITNEDNGVLTLCFADESSAEAFMVSHTGDADEALIQRAALAQQEQEPFGYIWPTGRHPEFRYIKQMRDGVAGMPLYTHPPRREWVSLTEEEVWSQYQTLWPFHPAEEPRLAADISKFARAIEQALRSRNEQA